MRSNNCQISSPSDNRFSESSAFQSPLLFANNDHKQSQEQSRQSATAMAAAKLMLENLAFVADGQSQQSQHLSLPHQFVANTNSTATSPHSNSQQLSPPLSAIFASSPTASSAINQLAMSHLATGNSIDSSAISPLLFPPIYPHKFNERKRRRVIGNLDNTLDGLVAKRVDVDAPLKKRYQTETEAIELPDDEIETQRMETDPDVSTRMCSVCGYQGKWVSEMIRHKRVHTSERPFKCKYCNRTSKWKADLIRHVAKTHGIRVVSKYSRSKAFEVNSTEETLVDDNNNDEDFGHSDENNNKSLPTTNSMARKAHRLSALTRNNRLVQRQMHNHQYETNNANNHFQFFCPEAKSPRSFGGSPLGTVTSAYRCLTCSFEQDSFSVLVAHLHAVHDQSPFHCTHCQRSFEEVGVVTEHYQLTSHRICPSFALKLNFAMVASGGRNGSQSSPLAPPPFSFGQMLQHKSPSLPFATGFFASLPQPTTTTMFGPSPTLSAHSSTSSSSAFSTCSLATVAGDECNDDVQLVIENRNTNEPNEEEESEIVVDLESDQQKTTNSHKIADCTNLNQHGQRSAGSTSPNAETSSNQSPKSNFEMPIDLTLHDQQQQYFSVAATTTPSPARHSPIDGSQVVANNLAFLFAAIQPKIVSSAAAIAYKRNVALGPTAQLPMVPPFAVALQKLSTQNPLAALNFCSSLLELQKKAAMAT